MQVLWLGASLLITAVSVHASPADRSPWFQHCVSTCLDNATLCEERLAQRDPIARQVDDTFGWTCLDECRQFCIWQYTNISLTKWNFTYKFFGRWPLIRYFGMLEPASSLASLGNLISSILGFIYLRTRIGSRSIFLPCYYIMFTLTVITWLSSFLFHIRDLVLFERMDYYGAFLTIFIPLFWFSCRTFYPNRMGCFALTSGAILACFVGDVYYMEMVKFDHSLHLALCTVLTVVQVAVWAGWIALKWRQLPQTRSYTLVFLGLAVGPLVAKYREWHPPVMWTFDAHSIFHILTIPCWFLWWWSISKDDLFLNSFVSPAIKKVD